MNRLRVPLILNHIFNAVKDCLSYCPLYVFNKGLKRNQINFVFIVVDSHDVFNVESVSAQFSGNESGTFRF